MRDDASDAAPPPVSGDVPHTPSARLTKRRLRVRPRPPRRTREKLLRAESALYRLEARYRRETKQLGAVLSAALRLRDMPGDRLFDEILRLVATELDHDRGLVLAPRDAIATTSRRRAASTRPRSPRSARRVPRALVDGVANGEQGVADVLAALGFSQGLAGLIPHRADGHPARRRPLRRARAVPRSDRRRRSPPLRALARSDREPAREPGAARARLGRAPQAPSGEPRPPRQARRARAAPRPSSTPPIASPRSAASSAASSSTSRRRSTTSPIASTSSPTAPRVRQGLRAALRVARAEGADGVRRGDRASRPASISPAGSPQCPRPRAAPAPMRRGCETSRARRDA